MTLGAQAKVVYQFSHEDNILVELFTLRTSEDNLFVASIFLVSEHPYVNPKSITNHNLKSERTHARPREHKQKLRINLLMKITFWLNSLPCVLPKIICS